MSSSPLSRLLYSAAPSWTNNVLMMITGKIAQTTQILNVNNEVTLRCQPNFNCRRRCIGAKTMPRITAQNTAP